MTHAQPAAPGIAVRDRDAVAPVHFPLVPGDPALAVADLLAATRRHLTTRVDLDAVDAEDPDTVAVLGELARRRREELLGLELRCRVPATVTAAQASLLGGAGVRHAALEPPVVTAGHDGVALVGRHLAAVRRLHGEEISVAWDLPLPSASDAATVAAVVEAIAPATHLPPPDGTSGPPATTGEAALPEGLRQALDRWRSEHAPWTLTYARGPGFIRISDRRTGGTAWTFIVLNPAQAAVFSLCESPTTREGITSELPNLTDEAVAGFLERLAARGVLARIGSERFLRLPVRRRVEERWASGDVVEH